MLTPEATYAALLIVQTLHLFHHRIAKRHISFAEVTSAGVLCISPTSELVPPPILITAHSLLIAVQIVGSLWIMKLSPDWSEGR